MSKYIELLSAAPKAPKTNHKVTIHGDTRNDPYFWMRLTDEQKRKEQPDQQTKKVVSYLNQENAFREKVMASTKTLQDKLYEEMVGRIKKDDSSVPYFENGYYYLTRYEKESEHPIFSRKQKLEDDTEELLIDVNRLALAKNYYQVSGLQVSLDNKLLAFGEDVSGRRQYNIRFKDLESGKFLPDEIPNTNGLAVWANDNKTVFYSVKDKSLRSYKVYRHILGEAIENDIEVFHEVDETFRTFVYKSKSRKYIIIGSSSTLSNEYRFLDANQPFGDFKVFQERKDKLEYGISHFRDQWFIRTNKGAQNFKVMSCPADKTTIEHWVDFIPHRENVLVEGFDIFSGYFVVSERIEGVTQIRVINTENNEAHYIDLPEKAHLVFSGKNPEYNTNNLRIHYTSLVTPNSVYDYDMEQRKLTLKKRQEIIGGYDMESYRSERRQAISYDGTEVPVSLVYHKDTPLDGSAPLLLYGYGSYGISLDPYFSSVRLSLLDRGFIYAIAHVRGGEEMGRSWYEDGKLLKKKNSFHDFIYCAEYLILNNYTNTDKLFAMGGSAGGLLMGAVINMRPDLWKGVIAAVPFVDVVNTMLDESIPLTTGEFDEWGNPKDKTYYDYIKSYSPYDNIEQKDYPALLVTTGYHDSQVQYWEPAKWVAKLRELKTDTNPLLLYCDMDTGHGGASGRFKRLKETALEYAFLIWINGGC